MSQVTPLLDFIRQSSFIATIKNAANSFHREYDKTDWPQDQNLPLGGEVHLEDYGHEAAYVISNLGKAKYHSLYESVGFTITIKFGEKQNRDKETMRRVTVKATICRDAVELYLFVRLFNTDGRSHIPGQDYTFDSRYDANLQDWVTANINHSGNKVSLYKADDAHTSRHTFEATTEGDEPFVFRT